jgi:hypothetical protein
MSLWWVEGFEAYGSTNGASPDGNGIGNKYVGATPSGTMSLQDGRYQGKSVLLSGTASNNCALVTDTNTTFSDSTGKAEVVLGFAFKTPTLYSGQVCSLNQNNHLPIWGVSLHLVNTGAVAVGIGDGASTVNIDGTSGTTPIQANTWHYIEFKVFVDNSGSYEVLVDGVQVLTGSADTMIASALNKSFTFNGAGSGNSYYIDDVYALSTDGSAPNDFLGDRMVMTRFPTANGATITLTPLSGNNYENVDDNPADGNTSYNSGASGVDLFEFDDIADINDISAVGINVFANRPSGSSSNNMDCRARSGGTTYTVGPTQGTLGSTYRLRNWFSTLNPDGDIQWDVASVNAAEFGHSHSGTTLRITRVHIEVLGEYVPPPQIYDVSAESAITVGSFADTNIKIVGALSEVTVVSAATANTTRNVSAESEITLGSIAYNSIQYDVDAESIVSVVSTATGNMNRDADATSTITFGASTDAGEDFDLEVTSAIVINQDATSSRSRPVSASTAVVVYSTVLDPSTLEYVTYETGIESEASANKSLQVSAESDIALSQAAYEAGDGTVSSIVVSQSAAAVLFNAIAETHVEITSTASANIYRSVSATSVVTVTQTTGYSLPGNHVECTFSPFFGTTDDPDAPTPPPTTLPPAAEVNGFRLQYPSTGTVTDELLFKNPSFGDTHRLSFDRINLESRGGSLIVFADPIWPKIETLLLSFSALTREKAHALKAFMRAHLGQEIRLIDHEHRAWIGVITNPQDPLVEDRRGSFTASFDFEGSRDV